MGEIPRGKSEVIRGTVIKDNRGDTKENKIQREMLKHIKENQVENARHQNIEFRLHTQENEEGTWERIYDPKQICEEIIKTNSEVLMSAHNTLPCLTSI